MSDPLMEIDEKLWQDYLMECRAAKEGGIIIHPSIRDYMVWLQEQDIDLGEV